MSETEPQKQPEQILNSIAVNIRKATQQRAVIVLIQHDNKSVSMLSDGCNHWDANHMLSLGIHINLNQHDEKVLAGEAGPEAQAIAQEIEAAHAA